MNILPCWIVVVTGRSQAGRLHSWTSRPMTWSQARGEVESYQRMGHRARMEELEEVSALNLRVRHREIDYDEAAELAEPVLAIHDPSAQRGNQRG